MPQQQTGNIVHGSCVSFNFTSPIWHVQLHSLFITGFKSI
jgi:hypothetical protein